MGDFIGGTGDSGITDNNSAHIINQQETVIEHLKKRVGSLQESKRILKETLTVLDEQLREFETIVGEKNEEIVQLQEENNTLQSENVALKEDLNRTRTELNETKSLKIYLEQKLKNTESILDGIEAEKESMVNELRSHISEQMLKNHELESQIETLTSRALELESSNEHLDSLIQGLRTECRGQREDNSNILSQYFREKNENCQLQNELEEATKNFNTKIEAMKEEYQLLEFEKDEKEVRLTTMVQQFLKLIEYTKTESVNAKKKKTFVERILGRDKDKETYVPPSKTATSSTLPRRQINEPATCVIREQNVLQNLEAEANKLRTQLASLRTNKENNSSALAQSKSELRVKPAEALGRDTSGCGNAEDSALAAMDRAINESDNTEQVSLNTVESEDLSGQERELYFAAQEKQRRLRYETDTDDG